MNELLALVLSAFNILIPVLTILASYIFILSTILQIHSTEGRSKAFSTCSSHISAVAVFLPQKLQLLRQEPGKEEWPDHLLVDG